MEKVVYSGIKPTAGGKNPCNSQMHQKGILGQDRGGGPSGRLEEIFGVGPEGLPQWVFGSSVTCPDNGLEKNP